MLGAGTDTVANTANVGFYHILSQKEVKQALDIELERAWPEKDSPFSYEQAEKLPYLVSVVQTVSIVVAHCNHSHRRPS